MTDLTPSPRGIKRSNSTPDKLDAAESKNQRRVSIVLTGGPCSGKSSILAVIRDRLRKRGMQVITVPEYATHFFANSDGFQVEWVGTQKEHGLQDVLLRFQMMQEDMFKEYGALNSKPCVLICDRAVLDQKVFCSSNEVWESALRKNNVTERQLLDRYDMVMHLATCAKVGDYEWGPGSNNPGRYHSPEEAAKLDKTCEEVYHGHRQLRVVPHADKFQDKVEQVMKYLEDALAVDGLAGKRKRVSVNCSAEDIPEDELAQNQAFIVTSTYLDESMELSVQRRLRVSVKSWLADLKGESPKPIELPSSSSHLDQTFEERRSIPSENFLARRVISEQTYHHELRLAQHESVHKHVMTFQSSSGQHYELFYFQRDGPPEMALDFTIGAEMPEWLTVNPEIKPPQPGEMSPAKQVRKSDRPPRKLQRFTTAEAAEAQQLKPRTLGA